MVGNFLTLAFLFFIGSIIGWVIELLFRNLTHPKRRWINPGFCQGPYLPIYGFGLCVLYIAASLEQYELISNPVLNKLLLFAIMAVGMTLIEYIAGIFCLKYLKVRLWDYSDKKGNIQGIICPQFSLAWAMLGAIYYILIHPYILSGLHWLSQNLAFSFIIGMYYGILIIDVCQSCNLVVNIKKFAEENKVVVHYEALKKHIAEVYERRKMRYHFFNPFNPELPLTNHLRDMHDTIKKAISKYQ